MAANAMIIEYKVFPNKKSTSERPLPPWVSASYLDLKSGYSYVGLLSEKTADLPSSIETPCFAEIDASVKPDRDGSLRMQLTEVMAVGEKIKVRDVFKPLIKEQVLADCKTGEIVD